MVRRAAAPATPRKPAGVFACFGAGTGLTGGGPGSGLTPAWLLAGEEGTFPDGELSMALYAPIIITAATPPAASHIDSISFFLVRPSGCRQRMLERYADGHFSVHQYWYWVLHCRRPTPPSRPVRRRRRRDVRWERRCYHHHVGNHTRQHIPGDYKGHISGESGLH